MAREQGADLQGQVPEIFTATCPLCSGQQVVHRKGTERPAPPKVLGRFKSTVDGKIIELPDNCTGCGCRFDALPDGSEVTDVTFMGKGGERAYGSYCPACKKKLDEGRLAGPTPT